MCFECLPVCVYKWAWLRPIHIQYTHRTYLYTMKNAHTCTLSFEFRASSFMWVWVRWFRFVVRESQSKLSRTSTFLVGSGRVTVTLVLCWGWTAGWSPESEPGCDKKVSTQTWQSYKCLIFITVVGLWICCDAVLRWCGGGATLLNLFAVGEGFGHGHTFGQRQPGSVSVLGRKSRFYRKHAAKFAAVLSFAYLWLPENETSGPKR